MSSLRSGSVESTRRFAGKLHRRYGLFTLAVVLFVVALALLERQGWSRGWIGGSFLIATVLVYAGIGLASRTTDEAEYYVAGRRVPAMYNGMATAADWMSAASFIGTAGVLYLQGFDGLAYILGWTGGYCLVAILLAPYLRRFGQFTIPDFLGARYGGQAVRLIAVAATVLVSFVYVVVQVYGVGLVTSHLTGFSFEIGVFVGLGGVLVCSFLGGMRAVTWTQVAQYIVLIIAYTVPVMWLSHNQTGSWLPVFSYGQQLKVVSEREAQLLTDPAEVEVRRLLRRARRRRPAQAARRARRDGHDTGCWAARSSACMPRTRRWRRSSKPSARWSACRAPSPRRAPPTSANVTRPRPRPSRWPVWRRRPARWAQPAPPASMRAATSWRWCSA
jgi:cation/acetate symporter